MGTKVFAQVRDQLKLVGDEHDVMVDRRRRTEVWAWSEENGIAIEYAGSPQISQFFNVDLWRVRDEKHRSLFILRWGNTV